MKQDRHQCTFPAITFGLQDVQNADRESPVGKATRYGLDGPAIESRRGRDFPHPSTPALGSTQPPAQWIRGLFPGVKRPGRGVDHSPPFISEVKNGVVPLLPPICLHDVGREDFTFTWHRRHRRFILFTN